jgi:hypothetical protein
MTESSERFPQTAVTAIEAEFRSTVPLIFRDRLGFAFIFGGFGKGYAGWGHDIDMFIAAAGPPADAQIEDFKVWYMDVHRRHDLPPDPIHPGEVVTIDDLHRRLTLLEGRNIRPVIETQYEYEAILWADALIERKLGLLRGPCTSAGDLERTLTRAARLGNRWRSEMLDIRLENPRQLAQLDLRRLFKGYVKYLKQPGVPSGDA